MQLSHPSCDSFKTHTHIYIYIFIPQHANENIAFLQNGPCTVLIGFSSTVLNEYVQSIAFLMANNMMRRSCYPACTAQCLKKLYC